MTPIRTTALNLLARREHTEHELTRKLTTKGYPADEIAQLIPKLVAENLLSNTRFLENYIHYRRNKGFGPLRIMGELRERGITEELIDHHLNFADNAWFAAVREVWRKRFKNQLPQSFKLRAQQMRFLQYRGFTQEQIERVLSDDEYA
jgi:regulatory protein